MPSSLKLLLIFICAILSAADYVVGPEGALLPDPIVTPGAIRTTDATEICAPSFRTGPFRKTTQAMKKAACVAYGITTDCPKFRKYELDHLVPLLLGGLDDISNLWPEPAEPKPGYHQKDKLELYLKREVCKGHIDLVEAQWQIMTDWYTAWLYMPKS